MSRLIRDLPTSLQAIATRLDQREGLGDRDGLISRHEIDGATGLILGSRDVFSSVLTESERTELAALSDHLRVFDAEPSLTEVRALGPDGAHESTLYPPENGIQREVVRLGAGVALLGGRLSVPSALPGSGVVGVRVTMTPTSRGDVAAWIGGERVPTVRDLVPPHATTPISGTLELEASGTVTVTNVEIFHALPTAAETTDYFPVRRTVRSGETYEIQLSPHRRGMGLDQVECLWTASYSVPDPSGRRSDEGKPFYLDGVYCDVLRVDGEGRERQIDRTRFVDENEVDNIHDLGGLKAEKLRLRFFARDPAGEHHPITLTGVRCRYQAPEGASPPKRFDIGRIVEPGQVVEVELPPELRRRRIGRVDVRWTDMLSGTWTQPGYAHGTLVIDGRRVGRSESVQSPETQSFAYLGGVRAETGRVGVAIDRDRAQIDWIEVHFEE